MGPWPLHLPLFQAGISDCGIAFPFPVLVVNSLTPPINEWRFLCVLLHPVVDNLSALQQTSTSSGSSIDRAHATGSLGLSHGLSFSI